MKCYVSQLEMCLIVHNDTHTGTTYLTYSVKINSARHYTQQRSLNCTRTQSHIHSGKILSFRNVCVFRNINMASAKLLRWFITAAVAHTGFYFHASSHSTSVGVSFVQIMNVSILKAHSVFLDCASGETRVKRELVSQYDISFHDGGYISFVGVCVVCHFENKLDIILDLNTWIFNVSF